MDKRFSITLFVLFLGTMILSRFLVGDEEPNADVQAAAETSVEGAEPVTNTAPTPVATQKTPDGKEREERRLEFLVGEVGEPGSYRVEFTDRGGRIANLWLTNFVDEVSRTEEERLDPQYWIPLMRTGTVDGGKIASLEWKTSESSKALVGAAPSLQGAFWEMEPVLENGKEVGVDFLYEPGTGIRFHKRVRFTPGSYELGVELEIENASAPDAITGAQQFSFTPAVIVPRIAPGDSFYAEPQAVAGYEDSGDVEVEEFELPRGVPDEERGALGQGRTLRFAGVHNKYFAALLRPVEGGSGALLASGWRILRDLDWLVEHPAEKDNAYKLLVNDVALNLEVPKQGQSVVAKYALFAGPKSREVMAAANEDFAAVNTSDLGFFTSISKLLLAVLGFFHGLTGNWGVSIILLTMSVRLVLFPINRRSQTAMSRYQTKMKRVQPKIEEIKKKYENDVQRQRQEQAKLMQEEGAFPPLGGCLPMFLQIPVFWGLFQALRVSFDLRQAPFAFWIEDLSRPDALMQLGWSVPILGTIETLNVLPPLMVVLWILQQRAMPKPADEQAARMQKMMMWMPILFGFMLYNYAAGLSLYMITQSALGIFEQRVIKKYWPVDDTEQPKKKDGFMARLAKAQEEQMKRLQVQQADKARQQKKRDKQKKQRR